LKAVSSRSSAGSSKSEATEVWARLDNATAVSTDGYERPHSSRLMKLLLRSGAPSFSCVRPARPRAPLRRRPNSTSHAGRRECVAVREGLAIVNNSLASACAPSKSNGAPRTLAPGRSGHPPSQLGATYRDYPPPGASISVVCHSTRLVLSVGNGEMAINKMAARAARATPNAFFMCFPPLVMGSGAPRSAVLCLQLLSFVIASPISSGDMGRSCSLPRRGSSVVRP